MVLLFWGSVSGGFYALGLDEAECIVVKLETDGYDMTDPEQVREVISNTNVPQVGEREQLISDMIHLSGDYSLSYEYLAELKANTSAHIYNLVFSNCVQQVYYALGLSDIRFADYVPIHPNFTFCRIKALLELNEILP